jgi:preprotein translocase subunit YajC
MTGALYALLAASSSAKPSSSSGTTFIVFLVLIALVGYFLLIRPQKQKQRRQREQQSAVGVGDEVVTVGGIVGKVIAVDPDRVTILSGGDTVGFPAVGNEPTRLVLVRNAISRKVDPPLPDTAPDGLEDSSDREAADGAEASDGAQAFDGHLNGHAGTVGNGSAEGVESESEGTSS